MMLFNVVSCVFSPVQPVRREISGSFCNYRCKSDLRGAGG